MSDEISTWHDAGPFISGKENIVLFERETD